MLYRTSRPVRGFTLIELLVVIIILAILAAVVIPRVIGRTEDARQSQAITTIQSFSNTLDLYKADTGEYPTSDQGLAALLKNPGAKNWNGPYLKNMDNVPQDPWGHPYIYKQPGDNGRDFDISSYGKDGQAGGEGENADIQSWNVQGK